MDDEINKTSHENITHLAANTLYFLHQEDCDPLQRDHHQLLGCWTMDPQLNT